MGTSEFLKTGGVRDLQRLENSAVEMQKKGQTAVFVGIDDRAAGIIGVSDPIRPSSSEAIAHLHRLGLKIIMMTGDNARTANAAAQQLRIDEVEAGVEPQRKNQRVRQLREQGRIVDGGRRYQRCASVGPGRCRHRDGHGHERGDGGAGITSCKAICAESINRSGSATPRCAIFGKIFSSPSSTIR